MFYLLLLLISPVAIATLLRLMLSFQSEEKIMEKYKGQTTSILLKKYPEADINQYQPIFFKLGLLIALLFAFSAFCYTSGKAPIEEIDYALVDMDSVEIVPPRSSRPIQPQPKIPLTTKVEIVADEVELEPEPELLEEEEIIEPPTPIEEGDLVAGVLDGALEGLGDDLGDEDEDIEEDTIEEEPVQEEPEIFVIVEDMPEFPGGQKALFKFINENIKYPAMARENGIAGTVYVSFVIDETGKVTIPEIKRGVRTGGLNEEALRVVNLMPNWSAGQQRGKKVKVAYTIPIRFVLN